MNTVPALRAQSALLERARVAFADRPLPEPAFPLEVGWARSYADVFSGQFEAVDDAERALNEGRRRVLITGKGGGGKTALLRRLAERALESAELPVLIDLANWTSGDNTFWVEHRHDQDEVFHFLIRRFALPQVSPFELNLASGPARSILMIDGLSEVQAHIGDAVLEAVDGALLALPGTRTVVADRLVRRDLDDRWSLAVLLPIAPESVPAVLSPYRQALDRYERASPKQRDLLRSPYFLSRLIRGEAELATSRSAEQHQWFSVHASLSDAQIDVVAAAAFRFYRESSSRTFSIDAFERATSAEITPKLHAAGALIVDQEVGAAFFDHQLKHDFLAARHLARNPTAWDKEAFDTVTLHANSFDVLGLTLEQLSVSGDEFVRRVYDWNPYGAAYVVAENRIRDVGKISRSMEVVIEAVTAERRFHFMLSTRQQAEDALRVIQTAESSEMLVTTSLRELTDLISRIAVPEADWFERWKMVFTRPAGDRPDDADLEEVRREDSIMGWTYANVAKRMTISVPQQNLLQAWFQDATMEVRWRIVHIMGAFPSVENSDFLFDALDRHDDQWRWIRYGAVRSLVEIAARDRKGAVRERVMNGLAGRAGRLLPDRRTVKELERAVLIVPNAAPPDWVDQVKEVLVSLYEAAPSGDEQDRWLELADQLERLYQSDE